MKCFPLNKTIKINQSETFLSSYHNVTEIPLLPHPGAFGYARKNHIHEGVDLYCEANDFIYATQSGKIIDIFAFTGASAGSPWWNDTWGVLVESENFVLNYGEIVPSKTLKIGQSIQAGEVLGQVLTVLKKDKGRPCTMLHLEMYKLGTTQAIKEWSLNQEKPEHLLDPTPYLCEFLND